MLASLVMEPVATVALLCKSRYEATGACNQGKAGANFYNAQSLVDTRSVT